MIPKEEILKALGEVKHPGMEDRSILELGMVDGIEQEEGKISVTLAFPRKPDPLKNYLTGAVKASLYRAVPGGTEIEVRTIVREAPKPKAPELTLDELRNVRHIIGIASGKGGVGKSTVAVNLAIALARQGFRVGLADADIYGPSVPLMTGTVGAVLPAEQQDGKEIIIPAEKYGVKWVSIGYFADPSQALIWRGPMACGALKQMILQVRWGELDYLLIDMPPGTGDIHISLLQEIPMEGAVIVTTPQKVALADVEKGVDMFRNKNINRPVFGLVENMAWFTPAEHPDEKYYIFGKDGGAEMAKHFDIPLLARIPLVKSICEGGDSGVPPALGSGPDGEAFLQLAAQLAARMG
ncbi:MAG: Mrp/NBP35 family ATP-binding protein [Bacteroidales bacterium]|nr:Mrp/NBP35 family ATP-binding protein [Bacteroidales bacterium]